MIVVLWQAEPDPPEELLVAGFVPLALSERVDPGGGLLASAWERWGRDVRVRLVRDEVGLLRNTVVTGAVHVEEALAFARLGPTGVAEVDRGLSRSDVARLEGHGVPVERVGKGGLVAAVNRVARRLPRLEWDDYFMKIAHVVAGRSDCLKRKVAAILVRERRIIATGYNGTPRGTVNCGQGGCPRCAQFGESGKGLSDCLCSHGEENALTQAARHGICVKGATLYSTCSPCLLCTKMIVNSGIVEVVYNAAYPLGGRALSLLAEAGVVVRQHGTPA